MKLIINPILTCILGFIMASLGAGLNTWQFWVAMFVCSGLIIVNGLDL